MMSRTQSLSLLAALFAAGEIFSAQAAPTEVALPGDKAFPESITATSDGTLYVSSMASGGVTRVKGGKAEIWIKPGAFKTRSTFGVLADEAAGMLWVCSNDVSGLGVPGPTSTKGSFLKGFDLKTGKGRFSAELPGPAAVCNDIVVGPDHALYVTNTLAPQVLRLKQGATKLEVWASDPMLATPAGVPGLDGLAFGADGNLYVNTYGPGGFFRIDVKDNVAGKVTKLEPSHPLAFPDALHSLGGNKFLMIEGGGQLDRVTIEGDKVTLETIKDGFSTPTGVAKVGDTAWVSEGQLSFLFDPKKQGQQVLPFKLFAVPLGH